MHAEDKQIVVVGLGYVGLPLACEFANKGFKVTGLDIIQEKVDLINQGISPISGNEPELPELLKKVVANGSLQATTDPSCIKTADTVIISVQTPFDVSKKEPLYSALMKAAATVGKRLKKGAMVIVESTVAPTTLKNIVKPILERESGLHAGQDFNLASCPERVTPGKLLHNLRYVNRVIGGYTEKCGERARKLYSHIVQAEIDVVDSTTAELVKTVENAYRDVQIAFANEIALLCENVGVDVFKVRELVNKVPERNMHIPGTGVGGHCIPKDSWLLIYGTKGGYYPKLLITARDINEYMPHHVAELTHEAFREAGKEINGAKIAILGLSYLPESDDIRNTPTLPLIHDLYMVGANIFCHDPYVKNVDRYNHEFTLSHNLEETIANADAVVISTLHKVYKSLKLEDIKAKMAPNPIIVDGRNLFTRKLAESAGFIYKGVGK